LGILVLVFAVSAARANSVVNGSFETPTVPTGSFTNFITGSTGITGWTVVGPEASIVSGS
jgi:Mn2+/Fe2+ NRAMP family transporter